MNMGFLCFEALPAPCSISSPALSSAHLTPLPLSHSSMGRIMPLGVLTTSDSSCYDFELWQCPVFEQVLLLF